MSKTQERVSRLQAELKKNEAVLLSHPNDILYFTDIVSLNPFEVESLLLLTQTSSYIFCSPFVITHSNSAIQCVPCYGKQRLLNITKNLQDAKITILYLDTNHLPTLVYLDLLEAKVHLNTLDKNLIWQFRISKDSTEIDTIRTACKTSTKIVDDISRQLQPGVTEKEIANKLLAKSIELGNPNLSFSSIVAFGQHTASPHHIPTDKKLSHNTPVLIDFGIKVDGYCSDMTRTFWFGKEADPTFLMIEKTIHEAYTAGIGVLKQEKKTARDVDNAVREIITKSGYSKEFVHTSGHGIGLDVHEPPSINSTNEYPLENKIVITVEPGIYLKGQFGYRYENTVLLLDTHIEELTKT